MPVEASLQYTWLLYYMNRVSAVRCDRAGPCNISSSVLAKQSNKRSCGDPDVVCHMYVMCQASTQ